MNQTASVSRQSTVTDGGYKKTAYASTGKTYPCHLKALSLSSGIDLGSFGKDFEMHTVADADIKESDRVTVDGQSYDVKGVASFKGISFSGIHCVLTKTEDAT